MPPFITDRAVMSLFGWGLIAVGCYGLYVALRALLTGSVINPPDYPGDYDSFAREKQTFLYWLNVIVYAAGGAAGIVLGTKGLGFW